jgi:hypothetical protein
MSSISTYAGSAGSDFVNVSGTVAWTSTGNFTGSPDATYAQGGSANIGSGTVTKTIDAYNFNPSVPGGSTINGFQYVATLKKNSTRGAQPRARVTWNSNTSTLGAWTGSNADGTALTNSDATYTWGGATDLVGLAAPSVANVNSAVEGTGPTISFYITGITGSSSTTIFADAVQQTVWYSAGGGGATTHPKAAIATPF